MVLVSPSADGGEVASEGTKKKKLTGHVEKSDGRRLVEYLVVVSSLTRETPGGGDGDDNKDKVDTTQSSSDKVNNQDEQWKLSTSLDDDEIEIVHAGFKPVITARYPQYDHEDNPFEENVSYF